MRLFKSLSFGLVCSSVLAAAAVAGPARLSSSATTIDKSSLPPTTLNAFGRVEVGTTVANTSGESGGESGECNPWWDNGAYDGVNGLQSQELGAFEALVADDFFLQFGKCYFIDRVVLDMAAFGVPSNAFVVKLRFYDDCNGKPAGQIWEELTATTEDLGPIPTWNGFHRVRCTFVVNRFENGYRRIWLSPRGIGQGLYYWLTSNNGTIQGVQGQYRSAAYGFPNWVDVEPTACASCLPNCSDFNFTLCGKCCWLLKDNSDYDLTGLASIAFANGLIFGNRAVDNFQVPPGESVDICRLEGWLATNCDTKRVFFELYENLCDGPTGLPITIRDLSVEQLFNNGSPVLYSPDNIPVYKFYVTLPGINLAGGHNYWVSLAALGVGTPHERAIWLFKRKIGCHINITEGQWRSDFFGFPNWTPVSNPDLAGEPRDFAFRLHVSHPKVPVTNPPESGNPTGPGSILGAVKNPAEGSQVGGVKLAD